LACDFVKFVTAGKEERGGEKKKRGGRQSQALPSLYDEWKKKGERGTFRRLQKEGGRTG